MTHSAHTHSNALSHTHTLKKESIKQGKDIKKDIYNIEFI